MRESRRFVRGGPNLITFFFIFFRVFFLADEGIEDPNTPINWPSSRPASETPFLHGTSLREAVEAAKSMFKS